MGENRGALPSRLNGNARWARAAKTCLSGGLLAAMMTASGMFASAPAVAEAIPYPVGGDASINVADAQIAASGSCVNVPVVISIHPSTAIYRWDAEFTTDTAYGSSPHLLGNRATGYFNDSVLVCPGQDRIGTHLAKMTVRFYDVGFPTDTLLATAQASDFFQVSAASSSTTGSTSTSGSAGSELSARKVTAPNRYWKIKARLTRQSYAMSNQRVVLQRQAPDLTWRNTPKSANTNAYGRAAILFFQTRHANDRVWYRLRFAGNGNTQPSVSSRFHLQKR